MAYDDGLVNRIRESLFGEPGLSERRVFGSYGFLLDGNLCAGVHDDELITRVPIDLYQAVLSQPNVRAFPTSDRPMRGWIAVSPDEIAEDADLGRWVQSGVTIARSLPAK